MSIFSAKASFYEPKEKHSKGNLNLPCVLHLRKSDKNNYLQEMASHKYTYILNYKHTVMKQLNTAVSFLHAFAFVAVPKLLIC